jgi:hypothetical protein
MLQGFCQYSSEPGDTDPAQQGPLRVSSALLNALMVSLCVGLYGSLQRGLGLSGLQMVLWGSAASVALTLWLYGFNVYGVHWLGGKSDKKGLFLS